MLVVEPMLDAVGAAVECSGQEVVDDPGRHPTRLQNAKFIGGTRQIDPPGSQPGDLTVATHGAI